jgi:hypothetical protein
LFALSLVDDGQDASNSLAGGTTTSRYCQTGSK